MYYHRFRRRLVGKGIDIAEQDTPQELLAKVQRSLPATAQQAAAIVEQYQALMYGQARNRETEKMFVQTVRRFRFS
jgi:hypothetical protein